MGHSEKEDSLFFYVVHIVASCWALSLSRGQKEEVKKKKEERAANGGKSTEDGKGSVFVNGFSCIVAAAIDGKQPLRQG